ncbi:MAG: SDR family oxidoreductase [Oscillospiraceae bacterium]|nr:SDR family oxidoreductase [Oscillospiraceae bacterium]
MAKTALITGASGGFGAQFAKLFAKDGYNLVLTARSTDKLNAIKHTLEGEYGIDVTVVTKDLSHPDSADEIFAFTQQKGITVDVLVNNAGFGILGEFAATDMAKQQQLINLNILTLTKLCRLYLPQMTEQHKGHILNVASIAAFAPGPLMATYYASKAYVLSFSDALATELKGTGVTVTALCPGPVNTGFADAAGFKNNIMFSGKADGKAQQVSRYGYNAMNKGKTIALPDIMCRLGAFGVRLVPREFAKQFIYRMQSSRMDK